MSKQKIPTTLSSLGIFFFWMIISYMVFSSLWGNSESTIGQRGSTFLFLQNVASYLIFFPNHIGGLIFDLPFSFLIKPEYIFYIFATEIGLAILLIRSEQFRSLVNKFGIPLFVVLGLFSLLVNILTIKPCILENQSCLWWRIYNPHLIGLYGMALSGLFPIARLFKPSSTKKPSGFFSSFKKTLGPGIACALTFILIYFISIYIPWEMNSKFARNYGLQLMQSYQ